MRRALRSFVCAWLFCQLTGFVVAPIAVCHDAAAAPLVAAAHPAGHAAGHEMCTCDGALPGQACPMHQTSAGDDLCVLESDCPTSPSILTTLLGGVGLLPPPAAPESTLIAGARPSAEGRASIVRAELPDAPPPRA
jgi:hypothetical protein